MKNQLFIGIDLGGSSAKIGVVTREGEPLEETTIPTDIHNPGDTLELIAETISRLEQNSLQAIGFGMPGIMDTQTGTIITANNLPGWENYPIKFELEKRIRVPVFIENDANIAALGESWMGAGKDFTDFLMVTLGTGIGGAIILNNRLHTLNNVSCEFGHMIIEQSGFLCTCGRVGCLETFFSTKGLLRLFKDEIENEKFPIPDFLHNKKITPLDMAKAAKLNYPPALSAFYSAGRALGIALGNVTNLIGVQSFIIGGGVANGWDYFYDTTLHECKFTAFENSRDKIEIVRASLGEKAGWIGAAALAIESTEN